MRTMKLDDLSCGSQFTYGGVKWAVIDHHMPHSAMCISVEAVGGEVFDEKGHNDFSKSSLRASLNGKFFERLLKNGAEKDAFIFMHVDLSSEDGLEDYGCCMDRFALISCNLYRHCRRFIPPMEDCWWTCTPWSTKSGEDTNGNCVRIVRDLGAMSEECADITYCSVRPICRIAMDTLVSVI